MKTSLLVLAVTLAFMISAINSSFTAMLLYWWFAIFRPQDLITTWDVSSLRLPLIAAILFVIPSFLRGYFPSVNHKISVLFVIWLILAGIAHTTNGCQFGGPLGNAFTYMATLIFVVLLSVRLVDSRKKLFYFVVLIGLSLTFYSGKGGLASLLSGGVSKYGSHNLKGMFSGSNAYALGTGILLFFDIFLLQSLLNPATHSLFPQFFRRKNVLRALKILTLIVVFGSIYNIISLASRGAALATFTSLFVLLLLMEKNLKKILAVSICLVLVAMFAPLPSGYKDRIESAFAEQDELDNSALSRTHFWNIAAEMAASNPLGIGPGCYPEYYDAYDTTQGLYGSHRSVHSSHFQVLADTGYMGVTIWILLFTTSYLTLFKIRRQAKRFTEEIPNPQFYISLCNALICSQTVYLLGGAFYELAYMDLIWLIWGLTIIIDKRFNAELSPTRAQP